MITVSQWVVTALRHGFPDLRDFQFFTRLTDRDGSVTLTDLMIILCYMYHMFTEKERDESKVNQQFYDSLPKLNDMPPKPSRSQLPFINDHAPTFAVRSLQL